MGQLRSIVGALGVWFVLTAMHGLILMGFAGTTASGAFTMAGALMGAAGVLAVGVWLVCARWDWPETRWWGFAARHAVAALLFATLWVTTLIAVSASFSGDMVLDRVAALMGWEFMAGIWLYASVAGVCYSRRAIFHLRQRELSEMRARLLALDAQMSPHFLFNALHTVAGLIDEDPNAAEDAIEELAELLRYAMTDPSNGKVSLADEWEFTQRFLTIAKLRFGDRLVVITSIEPAALDCALPKLTLQPLVENAVRHGIANAVDGGTIMITAKRARDGLSITVEDSGSGPASAPGRGHGLGALAERLRLHYGDAASLRVAPAVSAGFRVDILIPWVLCERSAP